MRSRLARLRRMMREKGIPALAVLDLRNVRYLTGFTGSAGACVVTAKAAVFITDFRYRAQAAREVDRAFRYGEHRGALPGLTEEARRLRLKRLAFEESHLSYGDFRRLRKLAKGVRLSPASALVEELRLRKEEPEVRLLRRGARVNGKALAETLRAIRPGAREREIALALETAMRDLGASGPSFGTIVASGPRSALPHGVASDRKIRRGDLITIDYGAVVGGYHADTTRVVSLGKPSRKGEAVYRIVLEAQEAAVEAVAPGVPASEVDAVARKIIERAGYGKAFGHGTGHGVGLDIHEGPRLAPGSRDVLDPGMVVTIEPGIYLPGWGGVRIEDMVLVTGKGKEVLTRPISKELVVL
ncbi:MAG: aminopeptidase P family protein [Candidatus Tectomicrobia bacterium]|uniref:Aminopeptidase P family protein n=1 Tax=Tectimicrobiota bacterium TaxID=2528274 RepID=A0A932ZTT7_UNCTE|nr:aminopeptidase P family protein [Candidatus Tectomicrobia bacterium]